MPSPQAAQFRQNARQELDDRARPRTTQNTPVRNPGFAALKQSNLNNATSLRDKVSQWQTLANDANSGDDSGDAGPKHFTPALRKPRLPVQRDLDSSNTKHKYGSAVDRLDHNPVKRIAKPPKVDADVRAASIPKKRLVSDEHWKKSRSPAKETPLAGRVILPKAGPTPKVLDIGVLTRPGSNGCDAWVRPKSSPVKNWKTLEGGQDTTKQTQDHIDHDKTRPTNRAKTDDLATDRQEPRPLRNNSVHRKAKSANDLGALRKSRVEMEPKKELSKDSAKNWKSPNMTNQPGINKSFKPALEFFAGQMPPGGHAKFMREAAKLREIPNEAPSPPKKLDIQPQQVASDLVDSWLGSSPDPFVEDYRTLAKNAKAAPSLHDLKKQWHSTGSRETMSEGIRRKPPPNKQDSGHVSHRREGKEPNIMPDFDHRHLPSASEDDSPSTQSPRRHTLKRSGARRNVSSPKQRNSSTPTGPSEKASPPSTVFSATDTIRPDESASVVVSQDPPRFARKLEYPQAPQYLPSQALVPMTDSRRIPFERPYEGTSDEAANAMTLHQRPSLRRKLTSHADLMSVLSEPVAAGQPLRSACSVRSTRMKPGSASFSDLISELRSDELKYMRELRTLIDGVVPVLLSSVLSEEHTPAATANSVHNDISSITTPIVNMGIALERLRGCHKRLSMDNAESLVVWASHAHGVYAEYIKAWRMGFQDVIIDLAPATGERQHTPPHLQDATSRSADSENEKADVGFLLKRPLVRIRHLSKTFKVLSSINSNQQTHAWAERFQDLVRAARDRQSEERARLEDEAAASIDVTRVRDPVTLAPLSGVQIDPKYCVRARDIFDLRLHHSTGQRLDCRVELVIRDSNGFAAGGGDVLICEIENSARWLLLPPMQLDSMSARPGTGEGEIVVMIRGEAANGELWCELLCLQSEDKDAGVEWLTMLPARPIPPEVQVSKHPVMSTAAEKHPGARLEESRLATSFEIDVPIGEQASVISQQWDDSRDLPHKSGRTPRPMFMPAVAVSSTQPSDHGRSPLLARHHKRDESHTSDAEVIHDFKSNHKIAGSPGPCAPRDTSAHRPATARTVPSTPTRANGDHDRMARFAKHGDLSTASHSRSSARHSRSSSAVSKSSKGFSVWIPQQDMALPDEEGVDSFADHLQTHPFASRSRSPSSESSQRRNLPAIPDGESVQGLPPFKHEEASSSPRRSASPSQGKEHVLPSTPQQSTTHLRGASAPVFTPPSSGPRGHRRSSSPLKHEYAPSMSSEDSPDARDLLDDDDDDLESLSSASSADDIVPSLPPIGTFNKGKRLVDVDRLSRNPASVSPSQSASQVLYRDDQADLATSDRKIASIFCWSENGTWESLHPDECSIIVTAGLIEAFTMSSAHSGTQNSTPPSPASPFYSVRPEGVAPLIGLELTPLVPLRRGTAIDISIRSPPTPISTLRAGTNNIMFRSRNNIECEHLYNAINHARINNPTYIALQNACPGGTSNWSAYMDGRSSQAERPSWWRLGRRRSSYRASSTRRTSSVAGVTDASSVATMSSALSALRRFSANSRMFNVAKSTVTSHGNLAAHTRSSTTFSSDSGSGSGRIPSGASTPPAGVGVGLDPALGTPLGIRDNKIRLYAREAAGKWRDMGSARLTIMQPPRPAGAPPPLGPDGRLRQEKRVLILGKTKGETLLDVTAGEGSFERVARTGIAVSVWERLGEVGKSGGVAGVRVNVYMVQMKSEAEAAYTFSLVGRLRC